MEQYVGLDVSLQQTAVCVVDQTGKILREATIPSDPEAIVAFIKSNTKNVVRIGLESGSTSTWLWTELDRMGLPVICIDARHAKAALKMQINKSDRNDAVGIARIMQTTGSPILSSSVQSHVEVDRLSRPIRTTFVALALIYDAMAFRSEGIIAFRFIFPN